MSFSLNPLALEWQNIAFSLEHEAEIMQKHLRTYFHISSDSTYQLMWFLCLYKETISQFTLIEPCQVLDFYTIFALTDADMMVFKVITCRVYERSVRIFITLYR